MLARPSGCEPATPGLEGRTDRLARDRPRRFHLIFQGVLKVGGNCLPPQTVTSCHTVVTTQPLTFASRETLLIWAACHRDSCARTRGFRRAQDLQQPGSRRSSERAL